MITKGLIIGKFAPLHKGHQYVIETALKEVDNLIIFIYDCPETIDIGVDVRAAWLKKLYPNAKVVEVYNGPKILGKTPYIMKLHSDCIISKLRQINENGITHFYSSEFYGEHMAKVLNCINRQVDPKREIYNISATQIRDNPEKYKEFIEDIVYKDLNQ